MGGAGKGYSAQMEDSKGHCVVSRALERDNWCAAFCGCNRIPETTDLKGGSFIFIQFQKFNLCLLVASEPVVYHNRHVCGGSGVCLPHDSQLSKIQKRQGVPYSPSRT